MLSAAGLEDISDWLSEPVFWYGIVAPVTALVLVTVYLFWLDRKAGKFYRLQVKQKNRRLAQKAVRKKGWR